MNFLLALLTLLGTAASDLPRVDDFACLDQNGTFHRLSRHADARFVVLYVYMNDCPIVRQDVAELSRLKREFDPRGVRFLGFDPTLQDDRASVAADAAELSLDLPILLDETQLVAEMLGVTRAGEALILSTSRADEASSWRLLWRGPIDDRLNYGSQKESASREFLREALEAVLAGSAPPSDTPAHKGCAITLARPRERDEVDYVRDVAPILQRRCVGCHSDGGIGPWSMDSYERVRGWSAMVREVLLTRRMTPWYADTAYGHFEEDMSVSSDEQRTLVHWIERDCPRGSGEDPLRRPPEAEPEWPRGEPDLVIDIPTQEIPANGRLPYRKIAVRVPLAEDRWIGAIDLRPSNPVVLHHAFGFVLGLQELQTLRDELEELPGPLRAQAQAWLAKQGQEPEPLPAKAIEFLRRRAFVGRTYFARYFPGTRSEKQREGGQRRLLDSFPEGTGKFLPANSEILFELHYTTNGKATTDSPKLGLYFCSEPPQHELRVTSAFTRQIDLPPGERGIRLRAERVFDKDFTLYALSPHMHYRGRSMRYTAVLPDGSSEILLSVPEYVFDWQANYTLSEPRHLPGGTRIVCDAVYDNSSLNEFNPNPAARVRFGPRTQDEMFVAYMVYSEVDPPLVPRVAPAPTHAPADLRDPPPPVESRSSGSSSSSAQASTEVAPFPVAPQVDDFACLDQNGVFQRISRNSDADYLVLYVYANGCPIVRQDAAALQALAGEFGPRGVRFFGIDPALQDERGDVQREAEALGLDIPILMDPSQCPSEMLRITRTGEALVISTARTDPELAWRLRWRGPIDDRLDYGAQKDGATRSYLREALEGLLGGGSPPHDTPAAKGCAITFERPFASDQPDYADVVPILQRRCVDCHREGGIGPWKMSSYRTVQGWSRMIREVLLTRRMTPWHADPEYGTFLEDIGLEPQETRTVVHWVDRGCPRADPTTDTLAQALEPFPEWPLGPPDLVIELPEQTIPATGRIPNVDLTLEGIDLGGDRWVRAVDLRPSNPEILHHAFAFVPGRQEYETLIDELDELPAKVQAEARAWLADPSSSPETMPEKAREFLKLRAFQGRTYFAKYFPGQLVERFPEGTGKFVPDKTDMVFELHYTTIGRVASDRPRLGLYFCDKEPTRELKVASTWTRKVGMSPHERISASAERSFDHGFTLYSMSPHMHYRGRSMRFRAFLPDGEIRTLLSVTNYVFDWQANYTLREPVHLPAGTRIVCDAEYDNTAQNEDNPDPDAIVHFGSRTDDEMFVGYIVYVRDE